VADPEGTAGDRVHGGAIGGAVIGDQSFDRDAVPSVEGDGPAQERDRGGGAFVGENFDIGQAGAVVDGDVDELPALVVDPAMVPTGALAAQDAVSGAPDPAELLTSMWISSPGRARS
jgi:hypothetical protein